MLRILFVCQNDFGAPSEKQVLGFAQQLCRRGHPVMVMFAGEAESAEREGATRVPGLEPHLYALRPGGRLRRQDKEAARRFKPSLVHAWNCRPPTIAAALAVCDATGAPLFVHFEDDEWEAPRLPGFEPLRRRLTHQARRLLSVIDPSLWWHSTWLSRSLASRHAIAFDALTPALAREVDVRLRRPCAVVLPVTPEPLPPAPRSAAATGSPERAADEQLEPVEVEPVERVEPVGLEPGPPVVLITGTIWPVYLDDFNIGFGAIAELQRRGREVRLVHAGRILPRWSGEELAVAAGVAPGSSTWLGYLPYAQIPPLLEQADILLQPGAPSEFNRLRLPAKLQGYLGSGRPVITFAAGFGELLEDRVEVLKTQTDSPLELAERIEELLDDGALRRRIAEGGPQAARRLFDPTRNTDALLAHYQAALGS